MAHTHSLCRLGSDSPSWLGGCENGKLHSAWHRPRTQQVEAIDVIFYVTIFYHKRLLSICSMPDFLVRREEYLFSILQFSYW